MRENPSDTEVRDALERILASPAFRNSKQCQKFLRYVVEHSHAGAEDQLKERTIGHEVFGRSPDYDTADDPMVRVRATEVRKRLSQYYGESGHSDPVRFEIPAGSYRVDIHWMEPRETSLEPAAGKRRRPGTWIVAALLALAAGLAAMVMLYRRPAPSALELFWWPAISSSRPVLVYCGQPVVYFLSREVREKYPAEGAPRSAAPVPLPPDAALRGADVIPVTDQFVGIGNAHTAALLTGLFAARKKQVEIRYANDISFSDLRATPSVLIGAFSNLWTLEMTDNLRFVFDQEGGVRRIRDKKENRTWQLARQLPDGKTPEDYALVTRLVESATGQLLIIAGGITQYGTRAAGEFLTDETRLKEALGAQPPGWERKNLQVMLHTAVYKGTPASPKVIAAHLW